MNPNEERESALADCLADLHRRRALGEAPAVEDYRGRLGDGFGEFLDVVDAERCLDEVLEPPTGMEGDLPRAFGPYTLLREVGRGSMGVVYEAVNRGLGRREAVKILQSGFDTNLTARERFRREARACAQVHHPNVVEIYDVGEEEGRLFYSMALLPGSPLSTVVAERGPLDAVATAAGFAGVADALDALHRAGIVHRDVKPSNILVDGTGRMVLADFGIARSATAVRVTRTGQSLGTPLYVSPEQVRGQPQEVDGRSDVYGLGATMYEALAGRPPFDDAEIPALLRSILNDPPRPLREVRPGIPEGAERIVLKALEKRKEDRYATAGAMREDLLALASGGEVAGRPTPPAVRAARRIRPWTPAILGAMVLAAAGSWLWSRRPATLEVRSSPRAAVRVDGAERGVTPVRIELPPGEHTVAFAESGFASMEQRVRLAPGQVQGLRILLVVADPDDPTAFRRVAEDAGESDDFGPLPAATRGSASPAPIAVVFPRGRVRARDLAAGEGLPSWRVEVTEEFRAEGRLELRRGGEALWTLEFRPRGYSNEGAFPPEVLPRLRPGDRLEFGWFPAAGIPVVVDLSVVGDESNVRIEGAESRAEHQPAPTRRLLRARLLLGAGLPLAAYREARAAAAERPLSGIAWKAVLSILHRMGVADSTAGREAREGLEAARPGR